MTNNNLFLHHIFLLTGNKNVRITSLLILNSLGPADSSQTTYNISTTYNIKLNNQQIKKQICEYFWKYCRQEKEVNKIPILPFKLSEV